jgi:hypothetical protein
VGHPHRATAIPVVVTHVAGPNEGARGGSDCWKGARPARRSGVDPREGHRGAPGDHCDRRHTTMVSSRGWEEFAMSACAPGASWHRTGGASTNILRRTAMPAVALAASAVMLAGCQASGGGWYGGTNAKNAKVTAGFDFACDEEDIAGQMSFIDRRAPARNFPAVADICRFSFIEGEVEEVVWSGVYRPRPKRASDDSSPSSPTPAGPVPQRGTPSASP